MAAFTFMVTQLGEMLFSSGISHTHPINTSIPTNATNMLNSSDSFFNFWGIV
jgi:hypothetical protein